MRSSSFIALAFLAGSLAGVWVGKSGGSLKTVLDPTNLVATAPRALPAVRTNVGSFGMPSHMPRTSGFVSGTDMASISTPPLRGGSVRTYAAAVDAKTVKVLREATGAGMMDCKKALVECNGDLEEATAFLRKKGLASADKRSAKSTGQGIVEAYIHGGSKIGVMVEVNCETDFVAKTPEFKEFARTIAMQIVASPEVEVVDETAIPADMIAKEKAILSDSDDIKGKPEGVIEKIVQGRIDKWIKTKTLVDQPFMKNPDETVADFIKSGIAQFGENIKVKRFVKFNVGTD